MKIRNGFVSNSSSSSFCLLGICLTDAEEEAEKLAKDNQLCVEYAIEEYDDAVYVGLPPTSMKDEETLLEFKKRIVDQLAEKDPAYKDVKLSWITDGGYNG